jgi:hypothetical protein
LVIPKPLNPSGKYLTEINYKPKKIINRMEQKSNNKNKAIGGRPPLDKMEKRTEILSFKCTVLERHIINGKAMTAGVTLGEYIRNTAINGNITARLTPEDVKLIRSLLGMANNLNQLAKNANTFGYAAVSESVSELADEIDKIIKLIKA